MSTDTETPPVEESQTVVPEQPPAEETVTLPKAQADALRRELAEAQRKAQKLEADQKKAAEVQAAEQGQWQKLAEDAKAELEQTRAQAARTAQEARVTRIATKAKFIDPTDVIGRLSAEDAADDASVEAALERIAQASPHLVAKEAPATPEIGMVHAPGATAPGGPADGKPSPPPGKAPLASIADAEALSVAEAVARMPEIEWLERHT